MYMTCMSLQVAMQDKLCSNASVDGDDEIFRIMMITLTDNDDDKAGKELREEGGEDDVAKGRWMSKRGTRGRRKEENLEEDKYLSEFFATV